MKTKKKCDFCNKESTGKIELDKWKFNICNCWDCKRKQTIIFKLLMGDLSDDTTLKMARVIPEKELYNKPNTQSSETVS
ncbi:hypothetical protein LCGC14_1454410 [marine sediment metagenome]|uniref:Uncharacterized protein n=1 Tax=marine sediment metagenome TaxID=412755 RepID=A0A0F9LXH2_9ZZZZ